jgi:hypothetical protein
MANRQVKRPAYGQVCFSVAGHCVRIDKYQGYLHLKLNSNYELQ